MKFGLHISVAGGVEKSPRRAADLGCGCFQIFVSNPRSWALPEICAEQAAAFRSERARCGLGPVAVHLTYLVNLASVDDAQHARATEHFIAQYRAAADLGADFLVFHPGSSKGGTPEAGIERVGVALRTAAAAVTTGADGAPAPVFLLENMTGGGALLGKTPQELGAIWNASGLPQERIGVCLDTCHAYAAGHDLGKSGVLAGLIAEFERCLYPGCLRLLHCNDSRFALDSGRDRHWHIGLGEIGEAGMRKILRTKALDGVPVILETPVNAERGDEANLAAARAAAGVSDASSPAR